MSAAAGPAAASCGRYAMATRRNRLKSSGLRSRMARRLRAARSVWVRQGAAAAARRLSLSKDTRYRYETGRTFPEEPFLVRFSLASQCPLDWIFLGKITPAMSPDFAVRLGVWVQGNDPGLLAVEEGGEAATLDDASHNGPPS